MYVAERNENIFKYSENKGRLFQVAFVSFNAWSYGSRGLWQIIQVVAEKYS